MMNIKKARQVLKTLSDDTRLRIVHLLNKEELTVTEICMLLNRNQSIISKHLTRMRLVGTVGDRRKGFNVYYRLIVPKDRIYEKLMSSVISSLSELTVVKEDLRNLKRLKKKGG
ncbi:MAG: metalloregulator ArsR/SmtB family transcription factor [Candidatus Omnitrophica bacterium]|nr:metalloregulator ArsR/SmtB family transcription factor [Candidatus Omnitrophota bacterium]